MAEEGMLTKPAPTTKEDVKAAQTFTFFEGRETGDASPEYLYSQQGESQQVTQEDLRNQFDAEGSAMLRQAFGDFDNYLAYMTEREQLIQSGDYDVGNWADQGYRGAGFTQDQEMLLEGEDLTVDPSDPMQDPSNLAGRLNSARQGAYNNWATSPANQALLEKYGVGTKLHNQDGDTFRFNGSSFVKTEKVASQDARNILQAGIMAAATAGLGSAIGGALGAGTAAGGAAGTAAGGATVGGFVGSAASNVLASAIVQGAVNGEVDPRSLVTAGLTGGLEYLGNALASGQLAAGSDLGAAFDNSLWDMADALGTDVGTVYDIVSGAATGALTGQDLEQIALGALQTYTTSEIQDFVRTNYADSMGNAQVENLFDKGQTTVPIAAFNPMIETAVGAAFGEDVDAEDIARNFLDFATYRDPDSLDAEGTLGFLDPGLNVDIPDIDLDIFGNTQTPRAIKAVEDYARAAGSAAEDVVRAGGRAVDENVIQPIREMLPHGTTPDIDLPEGLDINLPSVDLPSVGIPSLSGGLFAGAGGAREFEKLDVPGITYERRPELAMIQQPQPQTRAIDQITNYIRTGLFA